MTLNKKKLQKNVSLLRFDQPAPFSWLSNSKSARAAAKVAGTLFSVNTTKRQAILPEEPLSSEVQGLLNNATNLIECGTGGHGRCANSVCGCRCHKARSRTRAKRRMSV